MHFADTAKTIITLCIKDLKMFGRETNFESTIPIPHHVETRTKTTSLSSRPRPLKIGLETYNTGIKTSTSAPGWNIPTCWRLRFVFIVVSSMP